MHKVNYVFSFENLLFLGELYLALVTSAVAHGKITSVDASEALLCPGVEGFISANDIPGSNAYGAEAEDRVFAADKVRKFVLTTKIQRQRYKLKRYFKYYNNL